MVTLATPRASPRGPPLALTGSRGVRGEAQHDRRAAVVEGRAAAVEFLVVSIEGDVLGGVPPCDQRHLPATFLGPEGGGHAAPQRIPLE